MKKIFLFSLMMIATVLTFAQKKGGDPAERIQKKVDHMTTKLNLTADQQTQVKELLTEQQANRPAKENWKELSEEERAAMKADRKAVKAKFDEKMAAILTAEQQATYKGLAKGKKKGSKGPKGNAKKTKKSPEEKAQIKLDQLTKKLDLSTDQQAQVKELMANRNKVSKKERKSWKELSEEERTALKAENKAEREAYNAAFEEILTEKQLAIYRETKEKRKAKAKGKGKGKKANKQKKRTIEE